MKGKNYTLRIGGAGVVETGALLDIAPSTVTGAQNSAMRKIARAVLEGMGARADDDDITRLATSEELIDTVIMCLKQKKQSITTPDLL